MSDGNKDKKETRQRSKKQTTQDVAEARKLYLRKQIS
jgi:hypothetical protein